MWIEYGFIESLQLRNIIEASSVEWNETTEKKPVELY